MRLNAVVPALVLTLATLPAFSQDSAGLEAPEPAAAGTIEEAAGVRKALETYLTKFPFEKGIVRVEPDPAGQRITLDPAAFLSDLIGSTVRFSPLSQVVSLRPDGNWNVFSRDPLDLSVSIAREGQSQTIEYRQESQAFKGIYSPTLAVFLSGQGRAGKTTNRSQDAFSGEPSSPDAQTPGGSPTVLTSNTVSVIDDTTLDVSATPGPGGSANLDLRQVYGAVKQTSTMTFPQGGAEATPSFTMPNFSFDVGATKIETSVSAAAVQTQPVRDLYAFALSHAQELADDPQQALAGPIGVELKNKISAILPLWETVDSTVSAEGVKISTLYGNFQSDRMAQTTRMTGISSDASLDIGMILEGAVLESPMIPDWAKSLAPDLVEFGFSVDHADLAEPAAIALREIDLTKDQPFSPQAQQSILAAFDGERITGAIKPSRIKADDLDVTFTGDLAFAGQKPVADLEVNVAGLDKTIETLQAAAASEPTLYQVVGGLQMAKGFARPLEDGRLQWQVHVAGDGSVSVNGNVFKGPDAAPDAGGAQGTPAPGSDL